MSELEFLFWKMLSLMGIWTSRLSF